MKQHSKAALNAFLHEEPVSEVVTAVKWGAKHPGDTAAIAAALSLVTEGVSEDVFEIASALASTAAFGEDVSHGHYSAAEYDVLAMGGFGIAKTAKFLTESKFAATSRALAHAAEGSKPYSKAIRSDIALAQSSLKIASATLSRFKQTGDLFSTITSLNAIFDQAAASGERKKRDR